MSHMHLTKTLTLSERVLRFSGRCRAVASAGVMNECKTRSSCTPLQFILLVFHANHNFISFHDSIPGFYAFVLVCSYFVLRAVCLQDVGDHDSPQLPIFVAFSNVGLFTTYFFLSALPSIYTSSFVGCPLFTPVI